MSDTNYEFLSLVPEGWIRDYLLAMHAAQNEMPLPFHFLSACVTVGQMLGLSTWATLAKGVRIYPNINAMLLSPAGACRRGEGTKITMAIAKLAGLNVLSGKTTPEGLKDELLERGDTLLYVEELSQLLTKQDFQRAIIPELTKLLLHGDGPADMRTRTAGKKVTIPYINLSALFTSAPDWFMHTIPREAFGGGLMSRFLVCCLEEREVFNIDIQADDHGGKELVFDLANSLSQLRGVMSGHVRGDDEAQTWIKDWYKENESIVVEDEALAPHRNRKPANLLRLTMILQASRAEELITRDALEASLRILNWMEPTLLKLYGMTLETADTMEKGEKRIFSRLAAAPDLQLPHSQLARKCASYFKGGTREMRACLEGMTEKGMIEPGYVVDTVRTWPPKSWKLKKERK